ncbi:GGDEF domain-containing protein [Aminipila butyrica]|uniref:GGDEF domain-containing protein n=1 Tax=Aminipila butyrica TaxID=433296 RepID=A0A858BWH2_9FIRM|nr:GGDEF domain-containing protein [Aminipila butyrica]QIB69927.1 GGDEF domain-containing protein [Aminipila butyrica]
MDNEHLNNRYIYTVQEEYTKIDGKWLQLHYKTSVALVFFAFLVELVLGLFLIHSDLLQTTVQRFFLKFLVVPSVLNFLCIGLETWIIKSRFFSQACKIYSVSLVFVCINFVLFTVHSAFSTIYYILAIAILLTIIYANYWVTAVTAATGILSMVISELFIQWDLDKVSLFHSTYRLSEFLVALITLSAFSVACMVIIRFERKKNSASIRKEIERRQLQQRVYLDEMTGIHNRKAFHDELKAMEAGAAEAVNILAMIDIDKFKIINDTWGHHVGDRCLIKFAKILQESDGKHENIRAFRYGGDEFCLLFWDMSMEEAEGVCRQIQERANELDFAESPELKMLISFGLEAASEPMDSSKLFIYADRALYQAKKAGNAICVYE